MSSLKHNLSGRLALLALWLAGCAPTSAPSATPTALADPAPAGQRAAVDAVNVEIGVGSPIPVNVMVDASFPDSCAQVASMEQNFAGSAFDIALTTSAADAACASPMGSLPFRLSIPLNAVGLEPGTYTVTVNDVSTTFEYGLGTP